jgi:predicted Rossmann fold flavoprotein
VLDRADIAIIGAGAAGLMAAISAGRAAREAGRPLRIVALDGAKRLGAKILVAGGGRCNVTHHAVDESAYAGSPREQVRRVLRRFDVPRTVAFFHALGVELKREPTGKLFPVSDDAHTVLDALLRAAADAGVELMHPWRVATVAGTPEGFVIAEHADTPRSLHSKRLIIATGGRSLPRTGSDGHGYTFAKSLGHSLTRRIFPSLVPLTLPSGHLLTTLSGLTFPATLELRAHTGKRLAEFTDSTLCTHFGLSGPSVLDISRYYLDASAHARETHTPPPVLIMNILPGTTGDVLDRRFIDAAARHGSQSIARLLLSQAPERLLRVLCESAGADPAATPSQLTRDSRRRLVEALTALPLPIAGDRGFTFAEVTAGGVPLDQLNLKTLESKPTPGLHVCGEICDVDGRIGGFNFQWAWASGFVAGSSAVDSLLSPDS